MDTTEIGILPGMNAGLFAVEEISRARAEEADPGFSGEPPERTQVRIARVAIVDTDGRAQQQAANLRIPHDPAGGGEPQVAIVRLQVHMETLPLKTFQQRAPMAVHDGLGHSGRAGGIDHPQGMVERQLLKRHGFVMGQHIGPAHTVFQPGARVQIGQ